MQTIKLDKPWSYVTPTKTIDYAAGEHEVTNEIADTYAKEHSDGDEGPAKAGAKGSAAKAGG